MYTIYCELLIENTKKWDLTLHSGIVEMKATKKNWYMCMYFIIKFSKLRASQKKVVPETIFKKYCCQQLAIIIVEQIFGRF